MLRENEFVEFKAMLKDDIGKEVVAFANTTGGTIYIGIDDQGKEIGVLEVDETYTRLTNIIRDTIVPDVAMFISYELLANDIIKITVNEGSAKPYYLKKNGMKPSGVYVRQGSSAVQASWEQIRRFIKYSDGDIFEDARSMNQDLTFNSAQEEFRNRGVPFSEEKYLSLGSRNAEKYLFTNLALLLSDQCTHTVKVAVFDDPANTIFIDRREFGGSLFKQLHQTYDYLMLNNRTASVIRGLNRFDTMDYPPEAIRESLLNALIHRDYSYSGSIIININKERMEFVSIGGLPPGLSKNDIILGISQPRNAKLAQVFFRLKHIEAYGTGIRRIFDLYADFGVEPQISVSENVFRFTLPNINFHREGVAEEHRGPIYGANLTVSKITDQMKRVLDYISEYGTMNDAELMELLDIKQTRAYNISKQMEELGLIKILGRGKNKKYVLPK